MQNEIIDWMIKDALSKMFGCLAIVLFIMSLFFLFGCSTIEDREMMEFGDYECFLSEDRMFCI